MSRTCQINKEILTLSNDKQTAEKGHYKDFMSKEIYEQNITAKTCVKEYVDHLRKDINLYNFPVVPKDIQKIILIGNSKDILIQFVDDMVQIINDKKDN